MSAAAGQKPVRKFPPPCWTRDEALVLIEAYRERWYALHRAFLRTPDWDAVAEKVATSCPDVTPPKTSSQCRHKMEKLRQRHRAEKQRASAFSGERFFSTWFYFEAMEAMENGSNTEPGSNQPVSSEIPAHQPLNPGRGIRHKPSAVEALVSSTKHNLKSSPNLGSRVSSRHSSYPNNGLVQRDDDGEGYLVETQMEDTLIPSAYRGRESKSHKDEYLLEPPIREAKNHKSSSIGRWVRAKPTITVRPRKFSKMGHDEAEDNGEMWVKVPRKTNFVKVKHENGKKGKEKKKNSGISAVVSSIKLLGDGFMKMEKMKIEMAQEIEMMRMEAEMKRNELMLESQKQIVNAFVKGLTATATATGTHL